jgi:hypothetical protein
VAISKPDELDFDEELYQRLAPRDKDLLYRLFNVYRDQSDHRAIEKSTYTQDQLRKILAGELPDEIESFLDQYQNLVEEGVRTGPAVEYLAEHYDLSGDDLDVDTRYELLLLLHEEELIDQLDALVIRSRIRSYSANRSYVLPEELDLDALDERISEFHQYWNKEQEDPDAILVDTEFETDELVVLKIYQEVSERHPNTFAFREEDQEEIPVEPELTQVRYYKLKNIRFQVEVQSGETELIFTKPFNRWRRPLREFFEEVFSVDEFYDTLEERRSTVAEELEETIVESVEAKEDPISNARDTIESRRQDAKTQIEALDIPDSRKTSLKEKIETIEISGSEIFDDQSIETQEFRLIATLDGLFDSVDGIEEGFREMLKQADRDSQAFVLTINGRPVQFSDGTWQSIGPGTLPDTIQRALEVFFDGDSSEE